MLARVVVLLRPPSAIVGGQQDQRVRVVQAGCIVEPVVDDHARDGDAFAEINLPPGIRFLVRVERILAILDTVHCAGRITLRGGSQTVLHTATHRIDRFRLTNPVLFDQRQTCGILAGQHAVLSAARALFDANNSAAIILQPAPSRLREHERSDIGLHWHPPYSLCASTCTRF